MRSGPSPPYQPGRGWLGEGRSRDRRASFMSTGPSLCPRHKEINERTAEHLQIDAELEEGWWRG
jgi:hypothetical protein